MDDKIFTAFSKAARYIIIFPIMLVVLVGLAKLSNPAPTYRMNPNAVLPTRGPTIPPKRGGISSPSATLDLKGPLVCEYKDETMEVKVFIKNQQIYAEAPNKGEQERILVKGDCLYNWDEGETTGKKVCGIGHYMQIVQTLSKMGAVDMETIFDYLAESQPEMAKLDTAQLAEACVKEDIEETIFTLPHSIEFKEETLESQQ